MWHPLKGVIHLDGDLSSNESVSSDVEEVVMWDHSLRSLKTFQRAVLILSGRKFKSPSLEAQSQLLLLFLDKPSSDYFKSRSSQAIIQDACKSGWKTEASRKKKWSVHFVAEHLAFLLVLRKQVEKEKEVQEASDRTTRSSLLSKGVPKANDLKCAFRKLWEAYDKPLKLCVQAEREAENIVHRTPSLCQSVPPGLAGLTAS